MTIYIATDCPKEIDRLIREEAAKKGEKVMPARPFPWNRDGYATEPTEQGNQYVIPGCEKDKRRGPKQMDLF